MSLATLWLGLTMLPALGATPKRVLIVHSFGLASPPFSTHSTAFEAELTEKMGERVDLDEVSLDMARYDDLDMQDALVDYLSHRQTKWQPDLVVPIGSPAGVFVAQNRDRLFPATTPIIYAGMDQRRLPPGTLEKNAAFVGESFDFPGMMEDMLQIAPATTNIAVVIGDSPVERFWAAAIQQEWAPFTNRVSFTWLNDLPFDSMLERVSHLPPRSFIFLILLMRDASGVTHNADEALKRIHAVANAPVNGIFQHQLGLGIVGGRLYQAEHEGVEAADIAIRILHGEPAINFPPKIVGPLSPRYDWRELQRWKISADRLPPGSIVLFRQPTVWERYRWWIVGGALVVLLEAGLILLLVMNLIERRRVEGRFRQIFEASPNALVMVNHAGKIVLSNAQVEKIFGYRHDEIVEQPIEALIPEGFRPQHPAQRNSFGDDPHGRPKGAGQGLFGRRKDGSEVAVEIGLTPLQTPEGFFVLASVVDITERQKNETEIRQLRAEVWHADRVARTGAITSSLAHELNQPLAAILSNAQAALRFMASETPDLDEIRAILTDIVYDDKRAGAVISGLRSMLQRHETRREPVALGDALQETLDLLHSELLSQNVEVRLRRETDGTVLADKAQLQQVILNLVMNAMEALQEQADGHRRIEVTVTRADDGQALVVVRDTAPGISDEHVQKLFEAFWTSKPKGLGIGLPLCRSILESHGGRIWLANNQPGETTFRFTLPLIPPAP